MTDSDYMKLALDLAKKGGGYVNPNPMVGAVIVKEEKIIGQGYHEYFGGLHAERNAISSCNEDPRGATLYVTLEPCVHFGKTPPCTEAIVQSGISRVVIGTRDVNPLVSEKGVDCLRQHQIEVEVGILEQECRQLNKIYQKFISTKRPFVLMKYAMTMDGKIATYTHHAKWISGEEAREQVHRTRHALSSIMVGVNTILHDDPLLTCRLPKGNNPVRIICDTHLRTPITSQIVKTASLVRTYIATSCDDDKRMTPYKEYGCNFIQLGKKEDHLDLSELMKNLGEMGIDSVLLEGGSALNWSALEEKIVDEIHVYLAPKLFGGNGLSPVGGQGVALADDAIRLKPYSMTQIGEDYLIESEVLYPCSQES